MNVLEDIQQDPKGLAKAKLGFLEKHKIWNMDDFLFLMKKYYEVKRKPVMNFDDADFLNEVTQMLESIYIPTRDDVVMGKPIWRSITMMDCYFENIRTNRNKERKRERLSGAVEKSKIMVKSIFN